MRLNQTSHDASSDALVFSRKELTMAREMLGVVTFREARGVVVDLMNKLDGKSAREEWFEPAKRFLREENPWKKIAPNLRHDKRREEWELLEHVARTIASAVAIEPVPFLCDGEGSILGYDMLGRARYDTLLIGTNLGQEDAEFLLEHQREIPAELRQFILVFPGTVWRRPGGNLYVPCLRWLGGRWRLNWDWLEYRWHSHCRLLRLPK